jgi:2-polyprenyl-6-methoxyphenol hydroxylase-like FAD-dependent oxidoreductase
MQVLIAGGGIAGSVTAMALQKAGIESTVYEAHPRTDAEVGSYFTVSPNGLDALAAVDALDVAKAAGVATRSNILRDTNGRHLGTAGLGDPLPDGTVAQTMKRPRLTRLLEDEAIGRGIPFEFGMRLSDARTAADGRITATFADGSTATGDLLVGADGIHSVTRHLIDPSAPSGRYVGMTNFGGITRRPALHVEPAAWHMIFGRRAFFGYIAVREGDVAWFVNWPRDEITRAERAATSHEAWKMALEALFTDDVGPAIELIRAGELELAGDNTYDIGHVPVWHRGPMVIIGDAAHAPSPTSGQGASMAAEDGVVLAKALRDLPTIPDALAAYEAERRDRVERIVAYGARMTSAKVPGRLGRVIRDAMLRLAFRFFVTDRSMAWQFDHRVEWDRPPGAPRRGTYTGVRPKDSDQAGYST